MSRMRASISLAIGSLVLVIALGSPAISQTPKTGGTLNITQREDLPQGFAIHETQTSSTVWPSMPCFNNLVVYDPAKKVESFDTIVGDLAEKWSWQDNYRNLVFFLRKGVKWHDGQPFSSKDVKFTFDMVREGADAPAKLRINPRKDWYANIEKIETPDAHTVVFHLKRPQPSILMMLASGYSPVYAAHVPPANYRTSCVGTGPFKRKEWRKGGFVEYVRKPDAFWGHGEKDLAALPGYGNAAEEKAKAKKMMAEAGYSPDKPLKVEMVTRAIPIYVDMASFVINELKQIGIESTLKQIETAQWHAMAVRGEYQIGANLTGLGADDPDGNFYENYACGSPRNYTHYCNEQVTKMIDQQSQEIDQKKRLTMVYAIQKKLEEDAARPILSWRMDYFTHWPHVKGLVVQNNVYNFGRMQEVWRDK